MLVDIESDIVERKESWKGDAPTKARQAVCAFVNDLPNHNSPGVLFIGAKDKDGSPSGISVTDELLACCRMIVSPDDPTPTVLGILTLGKKPQDFIPGARIQFLRIQGISRGGPVVDELRIDGTLSKQLEQLDQKLSSHNRVQVDFSSSPTEIRHYRYPIAALQQLTRNAVMHRSYEGTNAPIMVYWFDDRIEIINAGGPYGRVTAENFGKPGFADYRNPNIAEIAKRLGKSKPSRYLNELVVHLLQKGFVEYTIPGKPNSRLQKYRITAKGTSNR